jgi:hypothetical protein
VAAVAVVHYFQAAATKALQPCNARAIWANPICDRSELLLNCRSERDRAIAELQALRDRGAAVPAGSALPQDRDYAQGATRTLTEGKAPKDHDTAVVLHDFVPESAGDLALVKRQVVALTKAKETKQWWSGYIIGDPHKTKGTFPRSYVRRLEG